MNADYVPIATRFLSFDWINLSVRANYMTTDLLLTKLSMVLST